jgi:hypothetical protein
MSIYYTARPDGYRYQLPGPHAKWDADCESDADLEFLAEEAAADFHSEHDGWERQWPLTITLYDGKEGAALGSFTVEREYEPSFSAQRAEQGQTKGSANTLNGGDDAV